MTAARELIVKINAQADDSFQELGLNRRVEGLYTRPVRQDLLGVVGLNRATQGLKGAVEINPVVGVRDQAVERALAQIRGQRFHQHSPGTISTSLGSLMPEHAYTAWVFSDLAGVPAGMKDLTGALEEYALPFFERYSDRRELARALNENRMGIPQVSQYRAPMASALLGDLAEARQALSRSLTALGGRTDQAAEEFRSFASAFERFVSASET